MKCALHWITALLLTGYSLTAAFPCRAEELSTLISPKIPFEEELYGLSYDVFLANSNPAEAFLVAERAVLSRPRDQQWRRKAAQSGEWSGNSAKALDHWFFLATELHQQNAVDQSFRLARALGDGSKLKFLLELRGFSGNPELLREYVAVCELSGFPEDAIAVLEKQRGGADRKYVLERLAGLYEAVGRHTDAITALLDKTASYGVSAADLLKAASLAYGSRDVLAAYTILTLGKQQIPSAEKEYWQTFGDLAWALQDIRTAEKAARLLINTGVGRDVDYQRLILLTREKYPGQAYDTAMEAWKRFGTEGYLLAMLELGTAQKRYRELALIKEAAQFDALKSIEDSTYYWQLVALVYQGLGDAGASMRSYRKAVEISPYDHLLAGGYIWLLLDLGQRDELKKTLEGFKERLQAAPELYDVYAAAYSYLGEYSKALKYYQARYGKMRNDPSWLAGYADAMEQSGWPEPAFLERLRALHLVRKSLKSAHDVSETERRALLNSYAALAMRVEPGEAVDRQMQAIISSPQDPVSRELVIAWAMSSGRSDLGRMWYWKEFARMARRPLWVELSQAMDENDRPRIMGLLQKELQRLPYRDAVEGASRVGWTPVAETHAFERFQINDRDHLLDQQLRTLYGGRPGGFRYRMSLTDQAGVGFVEQQLAHAFAVTPHYSLRVEVGNTDIRHQKTGILGEYASSAQNAQIGLLMRHERGTAEFKAGVTDALSRYVSSSLQSGWRVDNRFTMDFALLMGAAGTESVYMKIGGLKDEGRISLLGALTPRDMLSLRVSGRYLRDQERRSLGRGAAFESELTHRFLSSWPDTTLRAFGGYHYYERTGVPVGKALLLIPGSLADPSYYVPESFIQAGIGISVGQDGRTNYTKRWGPFASVDTSRISTSGSGFRYELGLVGPVFGLDKLELSFSQDSGSFGFSSLTTRAELLYRYYFE
ncbi:MAG: tetratricopeptide repeat protein [Desulfuromonadaceae bacterium]